MRHASPHARALLALVSSFTLAGCVESFGGSFVQLEFAAPTPLPGSADPVAAPADTYFTFYALDHEYAADDPERIILTRFYEVHRFQIQPVIRRSSPCFIDLDKSRYPGLHITQFAQKERERTGIDEPLNPPNGVTEDDITDVLTADRRIEVLAALEGQVKGVVSYSTFEPPDAAAGCVADGIGAGAIPAPTCMTDADNAQRLRVCNEIWDQAPDYYEGSDKVFSLPNNGRFYGVVNGPNPINNGSVSGASLFVADSLSGFDAFSINWRYKDEALAAQEPPTGTTYMVGEPEVRARGVISVRLTSPLSTSVFCEVAIFADLGSDDVNF